MQPLSVQAGVFDFFSGKTDVAAEDVMPSVIYTYQLPTNGAVEWRINNLYSSTAGWGNMYLSSNGLSVIQGTIDILGSDGSKQSLGFVTPSNEGSMFQEFEKKAGVSYTFIFKGSNISVTPNPVITMDIRI